MLLRRAFVGKRLIINWPGLNKEVKGEGVACPPSLDVN